MKAFSRYSRQHVLWFVYYAIYGRKSRRPGIANLEEDLFCRNKVCQINLKKELRTPHGINH